ncbi:hypothetical protein AXG93_209s1030 [Marchantia polymorpha subsp. ruderalis]|uniref:Uncharacterized protein n=1 Tax=Marchantia polymorpha subsp. ruderalis TaxID=1480154 RepID=A0A176VKP1_MARPO|nr:hypothetical protein AXG93_209s1030 [Marchantia polymorpha subsp. ruderalis]
MEAGRSPAAADSTAGPGAGAWAIDAPTLEMTTTETKTEEKIDRMTEAILSARANGRREERRSSSKADPEVKSPRFSAKYSTCARDWKSYCKARSSQGTYIFTMPVTTVREAT